VTAATAGDDPPQFDGYAVELLNAVAKLLKIHLEFYAVPPHGAPSVRGRTKDYGMWSVLVDQLLTEASSDFQSRTSHAHRCFFTLAFSLTFILFIFLLYI